MWPRASVVLISNHPASWNSIVVLTLSNYHRLSIHFHHVHGILHCLAYCCCSPGVETFLHTDLVAVVPIRLHLAAEVVEEAATNCLLDIQADAVAGSCADLRCSANMVQMCEPTLVEEVVVAMDLYYCQ